MDDEEDFDIHIGGVDEEDDYYYAERIKVRWHDWGMCPGDICCDLDITMEKFRSLVSRYDVPKP